MAHLKADNDHQWNMSAQLAPEFEYDQRIAWWRANFSCLGALARSVRRGENFQCVTEKFLPFRVKMRRNPAFLWAFNEIFGIDRCTVGMDTSICAVEIPILPNRRG